MDQTTNHVGTTGEAITRPDPTRFAMYPVRYPALWNIYKVAQASIWTAGNIDLSNDYRHWENNMLTEERQFVGTILAFFAAYDGVQTTEFVSRICADVPVAEVRAFYGVQTMMENVRYETYSMIMSVLIPDTDTRNALFTNNRTAQSIRAKANWCRGWHTTQRHTFSTKLIAFAAVEGIFFSSSFASISWLRSRGMMPGLCICNELAARDEGIRTDFACVMNEHLERKAPSEYANAIIADAVYLEKRFFNDALPQPLTGLCTESMGYYIESVADNLLNALGYTSLYHSVNPFSFMDSMQANGTSGHSENIAMSDYVNGTSSYTNGSSPSVSYVTAED